MTKGIPSRLGSFAGKESLSTGRGLNMASTAGAGMSQLFGAWIKRMCWGRVREGLNARLGPGW